MAPTPTPTPAQLTALTHTLLNTSGITPLHDRFRALFTLKAIRSDEAVHIIGQGFTDSSALLKHELAYCLGQMDLPSAQPILSSVLQNEQEDPMVRHEAAEALGALSQPSALSLLRNYLHDSDPSVRETCEIAIARIEWCTSEEGRAYAALGKGKGMAEGEAEAGEEERGQPYTSIDPAPPSSLPSPSNSNPTLILSLKHTLLDASLPLFTRYRAMFALRNIGTREAVEALAEGLGDGSALFKHEIAFIYGQLLSPHSLPPLLSLLHNTTEHPMVRHEAAEALGGLGLPEALPALREWAQREDSPVVVRESCVVALDMWEYENSTEFQYANGLEADLLVPAQIAVGA